MDDIKQMHKHEIQKYYDSNFSKTYRQLSYFRERECIVAPILKQSIGKSVLDIGAGDAYWLKYYIEDIDLYIAIEQGIGNCSLIKENFNCYRNKIQIHQGDIFSINFSNIHTDTLFFGFFISHFNLSSIIRLVNIVKANVCFRQIVILDSYCRKALIICIF